MQHIHLGVSDEQLGMLSAFAGLAAAVPFNVHDVGRISRTDVEGYD